MLIYPDDGPLEIEVAGLDRQAWTALLDAHPPRPEDEAPWNDDTFPPALMAACTPMTARVARLAWEKWPEDQAEAVFHECLRLSSPQGWDWATDALRRNPRRAAEVAAAMKMQVPLSVFLSWPDTDQDYVLAAIDRDASRCPGCGVPDEDTKRPGQWTYEHRTCEVCRVREFGREEIPKDARDHTYVELSPVKRGGQR